ncbi:MAG TPA: D-2-hydroxyacid dehydrogenase [Chloroflexia bacterium]|nr:D-2-hydroxyacid dehydrogenase [Chloroflexia bacterium]
MAIEDGTKTGSDGEPIHILVNFPLAEAEQAAIRAVSPRVQLDMSMMPEAPEAAAPGGATRPAPGWRRLSDAELAPLLARAEVLFTFRFPVEWLAAAPAIRWVQLTSAGVDHMIEAGLFRARPDVAVTTASGIHAVPISEHVIAGILAFARGFVGAMHAQREARWDRYAPDEAAGKTLGIIGYGPIGRRTARLAAALDMHVQVLRNTPQPAPEPPVERFYRPDELHELLAASDYVLLAAPNTPATHHLIDAAALAAMRPGAVLINIARGGLVDEPALIAALQGGQIKGAALDVFAQEPLPADSPLWGMPNVLITPHLAGANPHYNRRATELFCENLRRYLAGAPLQNLVDPARGY